MVKERPRYLWKSSDIITCLMITDVIPAATFKFNDTQKEDGMSHVYKDIKMHY